MDHILSQNRKRKRDAIAPREFANNDSCDMIMSEKIGYHNMETTHDVFIWEKFKRALNEINVHSKKYLCFETNKRALE